LDFRVSSDGLYKNIYCENCLSASRNPGRLKSRNRVLEFLFTETPAGGNLQLGRRPAFDLLGRRGTLPGGRHRLDTGR
jgi:hypothetical protein